MKIASFFIVALGILALSGCKSTQLSELEQPWYIDIRGCEFQEAISSTIKNGKHVEEEITVQVGPMGFYDDCIPYDEVRIRYESEGCFHHAFIDIHIDYRKEAPVITFKQNSGSAKTRALTLKDAEILNSHLNWFRLTHGLEASTTHEQFSVKWLRKGVIQKCEDYQNSSGEYPPGIGIYIKPFLEQTK